MRSSPNPICDNVAPELRWEGDVLLLQLFHSIRNGFSPAFRENKDILTPFGIGQLDLNDVAHLIETQFDRLFCKLLRHLAAEHHNAVRIDGDPREGVVSGGETMTENASSGISFKFIIV